MVLSVCVVCVCVFWQSVPAYSALVMIKFLLRHPKEKASEKYRTLLLYLLSNKYIRSRIVLWLLLVGDSRPGPALCFKIQRTLYNIVKPLTDLQRCPRSSSSSQARHELFSHYYEGRRSELYLPTHSNAPEQQNDSNYHPLFSLSTIKQVEVRYKVPSTAKNTISRRERHFTRRSATKLMAYITVINRDHCIVPSLQSLMIDHSVPFLHHCARHMIAITMSIEKEGKQQDKHTHTHTHRERQKSERGRERESPCISHHGSVDKHLTVAFPSESLC